MLGDRCRMDLEDLEPATLVRQRDLDLAVEPARTEECRVEHIRPVGCHDHLDPPELVEPVKLVEQLHKCTLDLTIGGRAFGETAATDRIDLVHENDAWLVILRIPEHLADDACTLTDV